MFKVSVPPTDEQGSRKAVISRLKEYRENEGGNYRIVCKRVRIGE